MLYLSGQGALSPGPGLDKALRNHECKQLVALVMDYMQRADFLDLINDPDRFRGASSLPGHVLDAVHMVVHEFIGGLPREAWHSGSPRPVHPLAGRIAKGLADREKQAGFYVQVTGQGTLGGGPAQITAERCRTELDRTQRIADVFWVNDGVLQPGASFDLPKIEAVFRVLSGQMSPQEFSAKWWR